MLLQFWMKMESMEEQWNTQGDLYDSVVIILSILSEMFKYIHQYLKIKMRKYYSSCTDLRKILDYSMALISKINIHMLHFKLGYATIFCFTLML